MEINSLWPNNTIWWHRSGSTLPDGTKPLPKTMLTSVEFCATHLRTIKKCKRYLWNSFHISQGEREIKFIGLFENRGHRGPYSPYKPFNHNLYIGIIIFPHIDNPQYTGHDLPKKKPNKIINAKKVRAPLIWQIIGEKDSGSVYMWI